MSGDNMSDETRIKVGIEPRNDSLSGAVGARSHVTAITSTIEQNSPLIKAERELLASQAVQVEDDPFTQLGIAALGEQNQVLQPTYIMTTLAALVHQNNTLLQAITAMEVNIDGTGFEIERKDGKVFTDEDKKKAKKIFEFFEEPYPGESFVTMRRALRRDLESTGNAYLEVIRNQRGDIVFVKKMDAKLVRMLRLDDAVAVTRKIKRGGTEISTRVLERQRRFAQIIGQTKVRFFKAYGIERHLNAVTGEWLDATATPNTQERDKAVVLTGVEGDKGRIQKANEIIHFKVLDDVLTPYGVPRWINNLPSVLGSRKAEEFNLDFFDHGGLPPAMIMIMGGQLSEQSRTELTNYFAGKAKNKQRAIITEIFSSSGDLGSAGNVKVTVERFGDERQKDSLFQNYDKGCAEHVRIAFRLPPMFLGLSEAYNFATAYTAYMIAEAQVFLPERKEFDEIINLTIMKELSDEYVYRSLGLNVVDVEQKLKAIEMSKDFMNPTDFIDEINEIARTEFTAKEGIDDQEFEDAVMGEVNRFVGAAERRDTDKQALKDGDKVINTQGKGQGRVLKVNFDEVIRELADDWAAHLRGDVVFEKASIAVMDKLISGLDGGVRKLFNGYVGLKLSQGGLDDEGVSELLACVGHRHENLEDDS